MTMDSNKSVRNISLFILLILQPLLLVLIFIDIDTILITIPRVVLVFIYFSLVPGLSLSVLLGLTDTKNLNLLLYMIGLSFAFIMGIGVLINLIFPYIGVNSMTRIPLVVTFLILISLLTISILLFNQESLNMSPYYSRTFIAPLPLLLINLPFVAIISITYVNITGNTLPLLFLFSLISIIPLTFLVYKNSEKWYPLTLYVLSLAILYPHTLWKRAYPQESWMPAVTYEIGYWYPRLGTGAEQEGILPESLLFPIFSILGGIDPLLQLRIINPLIISITPVAVFLIYQRYLSPQPAFLGALLTLFVHNYYYDRWGFGTRDAIASVFLMLFILALFDEEVPQRSRKVVAAVFLVCTIVSHWGVAFIIMGVLSVSVVVYSFGKNIDILNFKKERKITLSILLLAYVTTLGWYTFTGGGGKLDHFMANILALFLDPTFSDPRAGTSARAIQIAVPFSKRLLRILYMILTLLMSIGLLHVFVQRFRKKSEIVDAEYLVLSGAFLMVLVATFLPLGAFYETGRVLSIVYPLTGLFAMFGLIWFDKHLRLYTGQYISWGATKNHVPSTVLYIFTALIILLFLLGTGTIASFSSSDYSQSLILSDDDLRSSEDPKLQWTAADCYSCDGQALVWLAINYDSRYSTASDPQHNWARYYGFTFTSETSIPPWIFLSEEYPLLRQNMEPLNKYHGETPSNTYIFLNSKNHQTDHYLVGQWGRELDRQLKPLDTIRIDQTNRIYTNGDSTVHLSESEDN